MEKPIAEMGADELRSLIAARFAEACRSGVLTRIAHVARTLGQCTNATYSHYNYRVGDVVVWVDDYGGYMTAEVAGRKVCSTHFTQAFFIPGDWVSAVLDSQAEADASRERAASEQKDAERRKLLGMVAID